MIKGAIVPLLSWFRVVVQMMLPILILRMTVSGGLETFLLVMVHIIRKIF